MKVLGQPISFNYLEVFYWENFIMRGFSLLGEFIIGASTVQTLASATLNFQLQKLTLSFTAAMVVVSLEESEEPGPR